MNWRARRRHNANGMAVHTERRLVTCLFVDIVSSTDTVVRLGPERMQRLLSEAFATMSATITEHGGTVEKYVGDAIFALFGVPVAHVDDPERALRAAEACAAWSSAGIADGARPAVRVGIETGEALVDLNAVDVRQRIAVGTVLNVAARLQQGAEPGEIVVGPTCHEATQGVAQFESMGALSLKGLGEVEGWRFIGFGASDAAQELAFVGREAELGRLSGACELASSGTSTMALIVGPPGQGKSRLSSEAAGACSRAGARLLQVRCRPGAETGANTPLRQLLEAELPNATPQGVRDRASGVLGAEEGELAAAAICHSAGLQVDQKLLGLGRFEQRELIAEAWRRYLAAVSPDRLLVIQIEDLHWADPVLLRIVDHLTTDLEASVLVMGTARPEFVGSAHLRPRENRIQVDLEPLEPDAAAQLARQVGDGHVGIARAAGNPLFIIELARSGLGASELPLTVQAAIEARLDELAASERELLQRASVAGETFDVRDAALLSDLEPAEVAGILGRVAHSGFVIPIGATYRFYHALVHDVAYGRLPVAERMGLHARYAVEGVDPADVEAHAHHLWEAARPPDAQWVWEDGARLASMRLDAFHAQVAAGGRLEERNGYEAALEVYQRAVELADTAADRALAESRLGRAFARQGRGDDAWEHRLRAIDLFIEADVPVPAELYADMLEIATMNWGYFEHLPDDAEVLRLLDLGERAAQASGDKIALARLKVERASFTDNLAGTDEIAAFIESADAVAFADVAQRLGMLYVWNGAIARGSDLLETVFERLIPNGGVANEPEALVWYAVAALHTGEVDRAQTLAERLFEEATRRSVHTRQHAYGVKALISLGRGDWDGLRATRGELSQLVDANPDSGFCLIGAAAEGYGAIADVLAGHPLPEGLDALVERMVPESALVRAGMEMVPKVMANDLGVLPEALASYAPGLRLWDRSTAWDGSDLMPAIALTMLERWDELGPSRQRLDLFASGGSRLAAAVLKAISEEEHASNGGPPATHEELLGLGYSGISELLHFRPSS